MEKKEFYTLEDLKEFLDFSDDESKLSDYCQEKKCSMIIPLTSSIGQSIPPFFSDTEPNMPATILYKPNITLFDDVKEIVSYWISERKRASNLPEIAGNDEQKMIELIIRYLIAFNYMKNKRKGFPINTDEIYKLEELWMKEGYISIITIHHITNGFSDEEKDKMKNIDKSMFMYIADRVEQSFM